MDYRRYNETQMIDILGGFQRYYATRYLEFKNDLKGHLKSMMSRLHLV